MPSASNTGVYEMSEASSRKSGMQIGSGFAHSGRHGVWPVTAARYESEIPRQATNCITAFWSKSSTDERVTPSVF